MCSAQTSLRYLGGGELSRQVELISFQKNCNFCSEIKQLPYGAVFPIAPTYLALPGEAWGADSQRPCKRWLKLEQNSNKAEWLWRKEVEWQVLEGVMFPHWLSTAKGHRPTSGGRSCFHPKGLRPQGCSQSRNIIVMVPSFGHLWLWMS